MGLTQTQPQVVQNGMAVKAYNIILLQENELSMKPYVGFNHPSTASLEFVSLHLTLYWFCIPQVQDCIFIQSYIQSKEREYLFYMLVSILIFVLYMKKYFKTYKSTSLKTSFTQIRLAWWQIGSYSRRGLLSTLSTSAPFVENNPHTITALAYLLLLTSVNTIQMSRSCYI